MGDTKPDSVQAYKEVSAHTAIASLKVSYRSIESFLALHLILRLSTLLSTFLWLLRVFKGRGFRG